MNAVVVVTTIMGSYGTTTVLIIFHQIMMDELFGIGMMNLLFNGLKWFIVKCGYSFGTISARTNMARTLPFLNVALKEKCFNGHYNSMDYCRPFFNAAAALKATYFYH